jgi:hypothetical protein
MVVAEDIDRYMDLDLRKAVCGGRCGDDAD